MNCIFIQIQSQFIILKLLVHFIMKKYIYALIRNPETIREYKYIKISLKTNKQKIICSLNYDDIYGISFCADNVYVLTCNDIHIYSLIDGIDNIFYYQSTTYLHGYKSLAYWIDK